MAKIICKHFPKPIKKCIRNPIVDIIKTRKDGKDTYIYEVRADGVPTFTLNPDETLPAGNIPNLEDTWHGGQWPGKDCNGGHFDLNLYDLSVYGESGSCGVGACIYSCVQQGDYPTTNFDDCVKATVKCWFQDEKGKRTEFNYNIPNRYLDKFGEWDGKPIQLVKRPSKEVFNGAKEIVKRLKKFLNKNKLEIHFEMANDEVYLLPKQGWRDATRDDVLKAMKASGKILNPRTVAKKWGWVRGSELDDNWFCKGGK